MKSIFDKETILKQCEEFFELYNEIGDRTAKMCEAKLIHTRAVALSCIRIAEELGLDEYDTDLAWIIGELHDFARFGQAVVTKTFRDSDRFNHARLGARLLFDHHLVDDIILNFNEVSEEDQLVMKKTVYHHGDFHLPDDLTDRERLFCNIIRQADQIDIFRTIVLSGWETIYATSKQEILDSDISEGILEAFRNKTLADYSKRETPADYHMAHIALGFGLELDSAKKRAIEEGYLMQMMDITFSDPAVQEKYLKAKASVEEFFNIV